MRRQLGIRRAAAVVTAVLSLGASMTLAGSSPASADDAQAAIASAGWYSQLQGAGGTPTSDDPSVPPDGLAVAGPADTSGAPPKDVALSLDLAAVPPGAHIDRFVVTLLLHERAQQGFADASPPPLVACSAIGSVRGASGAQPFTDRPTVDCTTAAAAGRYDSTLHSWTFDVTAIAQRWLGGGRPTLAITNDPSNTVVPYQVVFAGTPSMRAAVAYTRPATVTTRALAAAPDAAPPTAPAPGDLDLPPLPAPVEVPRALVVAEPAGSSPVVAGQLRRAPATRSLRAVSEASSRSSTRLPPAGFYAAGAALAALLVVTSLVLGDAPRPGRPHQRQSQEGTT